MSIQQRHQNACAAEQERQAESGGADVRTRLGLDHPPLPTLKILATTLGLWSLVAVSSSAEAAILRVDGGGGVDSKTCGSAAVPCRTIQQAIINALSGDVVKIAQGIHTGSGMRVLGIGGAPLGKNKNLTLEGGYSPPNWDVPDGDSTRTILDGQNARRVIEIVSVDATQVALQNLTIQNGLVDQANPVPATGEFSGGGLLCRNDNASTPLFVTVSLSNVIFRNNHVRVSGSNKAASGGGAGFYFRCSAVLDHVLFDGNSVEAGNALDGGGRGGQALGGGLFMTGGLGPKDRETLLTARNVTFTNNTVTAGSGGTGKDAAGWLADALGGGAAMQYSRADLADITAIGNRATGGQGSVQGGTGSGGGLFFEFNDQVKISRATLNRNTVAGGASDGIGGVTSGGGLMATWRGSVPPCRASGSPVVAA